jgi:ComF family protein
VSRALKLKERIGRLLQKTPMSRTLKTSARGLARAWGAGLPMARRAAALLGTQLIGPVIEALLPADCPGCGESLPGINRGGVCEPCWSAIAPVAPPLCPRCGIPLAKRLDARPAANHVCGRCTARPPAYDGVRCALVFEGPVRALLHLFKFDHRRDLAKPLAAAIVRALPPDAAFDVVVPVPLHWTRSIGRGYNQAGLLARRIGRARRVRVRSLLVKRRRTRDQAHLSAAERARNLERAFAVGRGPFGIIGSPTLSGLRILLVDDVLTTGATAEGCARALKAAGAASVFVAAVARTPEPGHDSHELELI